MDFTCGREMWGKRIQLRQLVLFSTKFHNTAGMKMILLYLKLLLLNTHGSLQRASIITKIIVKVDEKKYCSSLQHQCLFLKSQ